METLFNDEMKLPQYHQQLVDQNKRCMRKIGISFFVYYTVWFGYLCYIQYIEGILISFMIFVITGMIYLNLQKKKEIKEVEQIHSIKPDVYTII